MNPTPASSGESHSRITRWRVRDIVPSEVRVSFDEAIKALAAQGDSRHAELTFRFDSVGLLRVPAKFHDQKHVVSPTHELNATSLPHHRWVIAPPSRDASMQERAWNTWLEAIDSMEGEPRASRRTMTVHVDAYLAGGEIPIATVEFSSFDCSMDELSAMQRGDSDGVFFGQGLPTSGSESEIERLTLALELAPQLRLAHRVAAQWRDEFDHWGAFPPYDFWPPQPKVTPTVLLAFDAWCVGIGAGIERIVLDDVLSRSTTPDLHALGAKRNAREPSAHDRETTSMREAHILKYWLLRMLRGVNRPYDIAQRAVRREYAKRAVVPLHGGVVRQFASGFSRSFGEGWREGSAMFFAPLMALYRRIRRGIRRALRQWRNRRR